MKHAHHSRYGTLLVAGFVLLIGCNDAPAGPDVGAVADDTPTTDGSTLDLFGFGGPSMDFADLEVFFEFNSTDNDLGFQVFLDAEGWDIVQARDPAGKQILDIRAKKALGALGITELRFESAEPSPGEVLALFSDGMYEFRGRTVEEAFTLGGLATLSTVLPDAPVFTNPLDGDGDVDPDNLVITWNAIGGLDGYEVIVANEDAGVEIIAGLGPDATSLTVPSEFMEADSDYKAEILAIGMNGNKTITEIEFSTAD